MWGLSFSVGKTEKSEIKVWAQLLPPKSVNLFVLPPSTWWFAGLVWGSLACQYITPISAFLLTWHFPSCHDGLGGPSAPMWPHLKLNVPAITLFLSKNHILRFRVLEIQSINVVGIQFNPSAHDMWWGISVCVLKLPPHTSADTGWSYSVLWWWMACWRKVGWQAILVCQDWEGSWEVELLVLKPTKVQDKQGRVDHPREIVTKTPTENHQFMPSSQFYQTETFDWRKIHRLLGFGVILGICLRGLEGWNACL